MEFEFREYKNKKVSDEELIEDIKSVVKKHNKNSLAISEYDELGRFNSSTIIRRFGSWNKALQLINLNTSSCIYTEQELFENLQQVWIAKGKQPARRDMNNKEISSISCTPYTRKYGTWSNALKQFIIDINQSENKNISMVEKYENSHTTSRDINLRLRFKVIQRDNFKCCACGASPAKNPSVELHLDHIIPWSKGG